MSRPEDGLFGSLRVARFLFRITALTEILLPPYMGSTLRGGFGEAFRRSSCADLRASCQDCLLRHVCAYAYCFATTRPPESEVLRTLEEIPRPFIIEPPGEGPTRLAPGEELEFGLVLVGRAIEYFPYFFLSFRRLGEIGLGKGRYRGLGRYEIAAVTSLSPLADVPARPVYTRETGRLDTGAIRIIDSATVASRLESMRSLAGEGRLRVAFLTMTRLKSGQDYARRPEFHLLLRALLRRISALSYFHCGYRIEADFAGLATRSRAVVLTHDATIWQEWTRFSARRGRHMELGGLVGEAEYKGELGEFLPWLLWGELVHVGKNATFGLGRMALLGYSPPAGVGS